MPLMWYIYTNMYTHKTCIHLHTHIPAHMHLQTMDQLKILLTEEGINFTDTTFNTEDGIRGLGEQPFVSKVSTCQFCSHHHLFPRIVS